MLYFNGTVETDGDVCEALGADWRVVFARLSLWPHCSRVWSERLFINNSHEPPDSLQREYCHSDRDPRSTNKPRRSETTCSRLRTKRIDINQTRWGSVCVWLHALDGSSVFSERLWNGNVSARVIQSRFQKLGIPRWRTRIRTDVEEGHSLSECFGIGRERGLLTDDESFEERHF